MCYGRRVIPAAFRSQRALVVLNVAAVGFALAAATAAVFAAVFSSTPMALIAGLPTWILGTGWALLLRWPKTVGKSSFRWGWVASMPLAMLNASIAAALLFGTRANVGAMHPTELLIGALLGATIGAMFWVPALIITLLCFGLPIAHAQRLAKKGLAGEERGEWIVGLVCTVMSLSALALSFAVDIRGGDLMGLSLMRAFAALGTLTGGAATVLARARAVRRRAFVAEAEAGRTPGYRVDDTSEGKVLVRVVSQGEGYRVADFEEELFELDAQGEATRPRQLPDVGG